MIDINNINTRAEKAWHALFSQFCAPLCVYVEKMIDNHDDSEDIVQETLLKVWLSNVEFCNESHLSYYLYRAAYHNMVSFCKKSTKIQYTDIAKQSDLLIDEAYSHAVKEELYRQLYVTINQLPIQQRRVIELSIEGKSGKEIADILGINISTVKGHKQKAIDYLKKNTEKEVILLLFLYFL